MDRKSESGAKKSLRQQEKALLADATKRSKLTDLLGSRVADGDDGDKGESREDRERRTGAVQRYSNV